MPSSSRPVVCPACDSPVFPRGQELWCPTCKWPAYRRGKHGHWIEQRPHDTDPRAGGDCLSGIFTRATQAGHATGADLVVKVPAPLGALP